MPRITVRTDLFTKQITGLTSQINMDVSKETELRHLIRREQRRNRRRRRRNEVGSCVICQENVLRSVSSVLSCGHYFHTHCIFAWINANTSCPTCRAPVECYNI
ncbi:peroxisome biogenesis factor 10-like [Schistocerca americana]|uniref:peroxisome biogenesis factor 10-like n=1 Tax=Schistocerca americana TaxID=7009 RepID=UPI001F4FAA25|nr:peroxisome biogenesis factor 10-like [Schistocerca americana]XP_049811413.1 peroxisome biogenesis factor 10-like [Schistocerca nitens]XP_049950911.1 peroxisome biogenesis factor 10-like [Schistocerca serialis cubense]